MSDDIRDRARKLFRPPFRFEQGYIWDARNEMVADNRPDEPEDALMVLRQRGWGRMSHMEDTAALYQAAGAAVAEALTRGWEHSADGTNGDELLKLRHVAEAVDRLINGSGTRRELELAFLTTKQGVPLAKRLLNEREGKMCQAYEGEREFLVASELREIEKKFEEHASGKKLLSDEELLKLAIEKLMLSE